MFIINLPQEYGYVLLAAAIIAIQIILIGFFIPGLARKSTFSEKFMKDNFGEMHRQAFGAEIKEGGYPDMGSGFYSRSLPYKEWYEYNNKQRAHQNYIQWAPSTLVLLLIAGIYFPIVAASLGAATVLGRALYAIGYATSGPTGRTVGVIISDLSFVAFMVFSLWSSINWILGRQIS